MEMNPHTRGEGWDDLHQFTRHVALHFEHMARVNEQHVARLESHKQVKGQHLNALWDVSPGGKDSSQIKARFGIGIYRVADAALLGIAGQRAGTDVGTETAAQLDIPPGFEVPQHAVQCGSIKISERIVLEPEPPVGRFLLVGNGL